MKGKRPEKTGTFTRDHTRTGRGFRPSPRRFFALPESGDALAVHLREEAAEGRRIFIAQQIGDLLGGFRRIEQQPPRLGIDAVVDDLQRRGAAAGGKEVRKGLGRAVQHRGVLLHALERAEVLVHEHVIAPHGVEEPLAPVDGREHRPGDARTEDDEALELHAQHLLAQPVLDPVFVPHLLDDARQRFRLPGIGRQAHHLRRAVEKKSVARDLAVLAEQAVEVAVEEQREVVARGLEAADAVSRRKGHDLPLAERHADMVHLQLEVTAPRPEELVQVGMTRQHVRNVQVVAHHDAPPKRCTEGQLHVLRILRFQR